MLDDTATAARDRGIVEGTTTMGLRRSRVGAPGLHYIFSGYRQQQARLLPLR